MKFSLLIAIVVFILVAVGAIGAYYLYQNRQETADETQQTEALPSPTESFPAASASPKPTSSPSVQGQQATNQTGASPNVLPESGTETVSVQNFGITVTSPQSGSSISSPVKVTGKANVFEGNVSILVKDADGRILGRGYATACMGQNACPFEASVVFTKPSTSKGSIEVFSPSPQDNSKHYLRVISVSF